MSDHTTQQISGELYWYMCQHIVGTENHVKQIRLITAARDYLLSDENEIRITSGSFGEGLQMRGSDLDLMYVRRNMEVYDMRPHCLNPYISYLSIHTDDVKPGFTQLRLEYNSSYTLCDKCVPFSDRLYLSSTLFKHGFLNNLNKLDEVFVTHGPCISDKFGTHDFAESLHCKTWIPSARQWITRSTNSWPSHDIKQNIIKHGVLFVPLGVKGSSKEDIEWRISFSVSEKLLVYSFTHTQLVCYALMKILLKDVIGTKPECKELLCSYFIKTIVFWISEELPQSVWKTENLIPCFMQCFSRLIYCVDYSVCLHYFIPESNLFENKIEGSARKILLNQLYLLQSYGWQCILFSDQVSSFSASLGYFNMKQHQLYLDAVERTNNSFLFQWANYFIFLLPRSSFIKGIQKTVSCFKSSSKYSYTYYVSMMSSMLAQSIPIDNAYSNNIYQYRQYTLCLSTLLQNIYHDAVSGWLMLASFFYKTKQYTKALYIIMYSISKCTSEKLYPYSKMLDIHHQILKLKSPQNKSILQLWKFLLVDLIAFDAKSVLIPNELLIESEARFLMFPSSEYACFLKCLCHYHLNDIQHCKDTLQCLQLISAVNYLEMNNPDIKASIFDLLGIVFHLIGDTESARQAFLQSIELVANASKNPSVKRLNLMS